MTSRITQQLFHKVPFFQTDFWIFLDLSINERAKCKGFVEKCPHVRCDLIRLVMD